MGILLVSWRFSAYIISQSSKVPCPFPESPVFFLCHVLFGDWCLMVYIPQHHISDKWIKICATMFYDYIRKPLGQLQHWGDSQWWLNDCIDMLVSVNYRSSHTETSHDIICLSFAVLFKQYYMNTLLLHSYKCPVDKNRFDGQIMHLNHSQCLSRAIVDFSFIQFNKWNI